MKKRKRINKLVLTWRLVVVLSLTLNAMGIYKSMVGYIEDLPQVKRYTIRMAIKGFLSQWSFDYLIK